MPTNVMKLNAKDRVAHARQAVKDAQEKVHAKNVEARYNRTKRFLRGAALVAVTAVVVRKTACNSHDFDA